MLPIKRVLVALDLTDMDETLISYTSYLNSVMNFDKVYFFHVARNLELPENLTEKYPDLLAPTDEALEDLIKGHVDKFFKGDTETSIQVLEGNPGDKILRWSDIKEIDLMVVGKKSSLKGSGQLPNNLAKFGHCSLLAVPENAENNITSVMVAMDFSNSSKGVLDEAIKIADETGAHLVIQHTYVVPIGYHKSGKSYEEFSEIIKGHAQNQADKILKEKGLTQEKCTVSLSLDDDNEPSDKIFADAQHHHVNLLMVASKGRTGISNILMGSVADKILNYKSSIPILVVKSKRENFGFIDALLKI